MLWISKLIKSKAYNIKLSPKNLHIKHVNILTDANQATCQFYINKRSYYRKLTLQ